MNWLTFNLKITFFSPLLNKTRKWYKYRQYNFYPSLKLNSVSPEAYTLYVVTHVFRVLYIYIHNTKHVCRHIWYVVYLWHFPTRKYEPDFHSLDCNEINFTSLNFSIQWTYDECTRTLYRISQINIFFFAFHVSSYNSLRLVKSHVYINIMLLSKLCQFQV